MSAHFKFLLCLPALALLAGCSLGIKGSGVSKTDVRTVSTFKSISHDAVGSVSVTIGEPQSVSITFDDNLIDFVDTKVIDGELTISMSESFSSNLGMKVAITIPEIESLHVKGVGSLDVTGVDSEDLTIKVTGVGSAKATGKTKNLTAVVSGVGSANLEQLQAEKVTVNVSGVGGATVYASQSIDANTSGVGGVTVLGNPQEKKVTESGIGKVSIKE